MFSVLFSFQHLSLSDYFFDYFLFLNTPTSTTTYLLKLSFMKVKDLVCFVTAVS